MTWTRREFDSAWATFDAFVKAVADAQDTYGNAEYATVDQVRQLRNYLVQRTPGELDDILEFLWFMQEAAPGFKAIIASIRNEKAGLS